MGKGYIYKNEDFKWHSDRPVGPGDFNKQNEVAIFEGPLLTMYRSISADELKTLLDRGEDVVAVDVLDADEYAREHLPGTINLPVLSIEMEAAAHIGEDAFVIVYGRDSRCGASAVAADKLYTLFYRHVVRLEGGIEAWKKAGYRLAGSLHDVKKAV